MLTVRTPQVAALSAAKVQHFRDRMAKHLAAEHPGRCEAMGEQGTMELIQRGIDAGARHGIDTEGAVGVLIELMVEHGERFERSPDRAWVHEILAHPTLPGQLKVTLIRDRLAARAGGRRVVLARDAGSR